jgi:hypothetical protein
MRDPRTRYYWNQNHFVSQKKNQNHFVSQKRSISSWKRHHSKILPKIRQLSPITDHHIIWILSSLWDQINIWWQNGGESAHKGTILGSEQTKLSQESTEKSKISSQYKGGQELDLKVNYITDNMTWDLRALFYLTPRSQRKGPELHPVPVPSHPDDNPGSCRDVDISTSKESAGYKSRT